MAITQPPYNDITGIFTGDDKHQKVTKDAYNGSARPGQLVVDTLDYQLYIGNATGHLNPVPTSTGNGTPGGSNTQIQFYDTGGSFGGSGAFTFNKLSNIVSIANTLSLGNLSMSGTINNSLIPGGNMTYNLGSATARWRDLYLSGTTIFLGLQSISSNATHVIMNNDLSANRGQFNQLSGNGFAVTQIQANNIVGNIPSANLANVANVANVANSVTGANVVGQVANALVSATVTNPVQTTITRVGALTELTVEGFTDLGPVANVRVTGGSSGQFLQTDGTGALSWATLGGNSIANSTSNVSIPVGGGNVNTTVGGVSNIFVVTSSGANTTGSFAAVGNVAGGNLNTAGRVTATGNITGGNLVTAGNATAVGNITGGNIITPGRVTSQGQVSGTSLVTSGSLVVGTQATFSDVANILIPGGLNGQFLQTDGAGNLQFASMSSSMLANGTSNVDVPSADSNVTISVNGTANVIEVGDSDTTIKGNLALVLGNLTATSATIGDTVTASYLTATDLVTTANADVTSDLTVGGNTVLGVPATITIPGGLSGQFLKTDGAGNLEWSTTASDSIANGSSNLSIPAYDGNVNMSVGGIANVFTITNTGANSAGHITAAGNVTGLNLATTGNVEGLTFTAIGAISGDTVTAANVVATDLTVSGLTDLGDVGNVTVLGGTNGQVLSTDGLGVLAWIDAGGTSIGNGTSNVAIPVTDGDIQMTVGGNVGVLTVKGTGANVVGVFGVTGNVESAGHVIATSNVSGANLNTAGRVVATGNVIGGNITTGGVVVATGNITGANIITAGSLFATGDIFGDNATVASDLSVGNNITAANVTASGDITGGNLTSGGTLTVVGESLLGDVANVEITGGITGQVLSTDGAGNLSWITVSSDGIANGTSSVGIPVVNGNVNTTVGGVANVFVVTTTGANVAGTLTSTGNVRGGNITTAGVVAATGNVSGGNITTAGVMTATGNVRGGNLTTAGAVAATGNVSGGNITTAGEVVATGNVVGGNLSTLGTLTVGGVSTLGDVANVKVTGGVLNQFLQTDGTGNLIWATPGSAAVANGTSELSIPTVDGNINMTVGGVANVAVVTSTGANVAGTMTATGNVRGGNLTTAGVVAATGNVSGGNITTAGQVVATANVSGANLTTAGEVVATGNVSGGNITTAGQVVATANVSGGNITTAGQVVATANVVGGNLVTAGVADITGTATAGNLATGGTLSVTGVSTLGAVGNVKITGGTTGQVISTDGAGNLEFISVSSSSISNGTSNTSIIAADGNVTTSVGGNANVFTVTGTGVNVAGTMNSAGALTVQANGAAITGNVNINGNLNVTGNLTTANVVNLIVDTPLIFLANANPGDVLDIGLVGQYNDGAAKYSGVARNHNTGAWQVYTDLATKPTTTVDFAGATLGDFEAGAISGASLIVDGTTDLGAVGNVTITGGTINQFLQTDGAGNLIWATPGSAAVANGTSELSIPVADGNVNVTVNGNANVFTVTGTGANVAGTFTTTGNISGANITTAGRVTATGNIAGGNITTAGEVAATGNVTGANIITAGNVTTVGVVASGNISGANLEVTGKSLLGAVANVSITGGTNTQFLQTDGAGNLIWATPGSAAVANGTSELSIPLADGNINMSVGGIANVLVVTDIGANVEGDFDVTGGITTAVVTATGNVSGGNITTAGRVVATGNINGGNITTAGTTTTDILTVGGVSTLGNVGNVKITGGTLNQFLQTDGSGNLIWATPGSAAVANGTSELSIPTADGNINMTVGGIADVLVVTATGANIAGTANITGDITTAGLVSATGNVSGGNITTAGEVVATGNVSGGNITTAGEVVATGNVSGGNITTAGVADITGNATAGNLTTAGTTTTGILTVSGVSTLGAVGNVKITGGTNTQFLQTDGAGNLIWATPGSAAVANGTSELAIPTADGNINVTVGGNANVLVVTGTGANVAGTLTATGNIAGGNITTAGQVVATGNVSGANITTAGVATITGTATAGNLSTGGTLTVTGVSTLGAVGNVKITGGTTGQVLSTDGTGNLEFISVSSSEISNGTSNTRVAVADGNVTTSVGGNANVFTVTGTGVNVAGTMNSADSLTVQANGASITGNVNIAGNLNITGNLTAANVVNLVVDTPLIFLANANPGDVVDIGLVGEYNDGATKYSGVARNHNTGAWQVYSGLASKPTTTVNFAGASLGDFTAGAISGASLSVAGVSTLGAVGNVKITGGTNTQFLQTDGLGNLIWATPGSAAVANGTSELSIPAANGNVNVTVGGTANVLVVTGTGANVAGTANITGAITTAATVTATGNISGGNLVTGGVADITGTATAGNLSTGGTLTVTGVSTLGAVANVRITGGTSGQFLRTNGSGNLTWVTPTLTMLENEASNVNIATASGNVTVGVAGIANVAVFHDAGLDVKGDIDAVGGLTAASLSTKAGGTLFVAASATIGGQATIASIVAVGNLTVNGNTSLGAVGKVSITGGSNGQVLTTNGSGVLSWTTASVTRLANGTSETQQNEFATSFYISGTLKGSFSSSGLQIVGTNVVSGNVVAANLVTAGGVFATGNANVSGTVNFTGFREKVTSGAMPVTLAPDAATGTVFRHTAASNFTFNGFTNPLAGQSITVVVVQDGTGSRTMSSTMRFAGGIKTLSTAPGAVDMIGVLYDGTDYLASLIKGYA